MFDISWFNSLFAGTLQPNFHPGSPDMNVLDTDHNGLLDIHDCPFPHGSLRAQLWWKQVMEPYTQTQTTITHKALYGDKVVGAYQGKALVPGEAGAGQGDFRFMVDKLICTKGISEAQARAIAGKVKNMLYSL